MKVRGYFVFNEDATWSYYGAKEDGALLLDYGMTEKEENLTASYYAYSEATEETGLLSLENETMGMYVKVSTQFHLVKIRIEAIRNKKE